MERVYQNLDDILDALSPLNVSWEDAVSAQVIALLRDMPSTTTYTRDDLLELLMKDFNNGLLICRLFLGFSKDQFTGVLKDAIGEGQVGIKRFGKEPAVFLDALEALGVLEAMTQEVNRELTWQDILIERLRFGRGSAVSGMRRGRDVEDFVEDIVSEVFGDNYETRCNFIGMDGRNAKCDIAIPNSQDAVILIEAKGYAATGSKQTDVLGDIEKIVSVLRRDQEFILFTDGLSWNLRTSDLRKLVAHQNRGNIRRLYTYQMADQFRSDLQQLKHENKL